MSHYAKVLNGIVTQVMCVADASFFDTFVDSSPGTWIQTSYNTRGGVHYADDGITPDGGAAMRGNYAGIGYIYDATHDVFYAPQPFPSWTLNQTTWSWEPPVAYPATGGPYTWDEPTQSWVS